MGALRAQRLKEVAYHLLSVSESVHCEVTVAS